LRRSTQKPLVQSANLASLILLALRDPRLHQFLNQCPRQSFVHGELDRALRYLQSRQLVLEFFDHRRGREQELQCCANAAYHTSTFFVLNAGIW
jgi:hypothetical protein